MGIWADVAKASAKVALGGIRAAKLLADLKAAGCEASVGEGGTLKVKGPLTPALRSKVIGLKADLLEQLGVVPTDPEPWSEDAAEAVYGPICAHIQEHGHSEDPEIKKRQFALMQQVDVCWLASDLGGMRKAAAELEATFDVR
jgi:hypothetical protein